MAPNMSWTQMSKNQIKLNPQGTEWKCLMNECLIKTDLFKDNNLRCMKRPPLDPNAVMDMRHKFARIHDSRKILPLPKEKIQTEAAKILREENLKKLSKQKEEKLITDEIERLKKILENHRLVTQKIVEEKPKPEIRRLMKLRTQFQSSGGICEVDIWQSKSLQMTMETKISESGVPLDVKVRLKKKKEEEEEAGWFEPVSCRKGSLVEEKENRFFKDSLASELKPSFFEGKKETEESKDEKGFNYGARELPRVGSNKRKIERAWKIWRIYTLDNRKRKQEKAIYENKIEVFLSKLHEKVREVQVRPMTHPSRKPNPIERAKTVVAASRQERQRTQAEALEKAQKLRKLVKDIKASREETTKRLLSLNQEREKNTRKDCSDLNFLLRMENRREERSTRWREIRERKLKLEEEKEKEKKEREEEVKAKAEKEKKRKLEEVKEKRRLEKEKIEKARREKEKLKAQLIQSETHYEKLLLNAYGFRPWLSLIKLKHEQEEQALAFWKERLQRRSLESWRMNAREAVEAKEKKADRLLMKKCLAVWVEVRRQRVRQWQVAMDWEELRLSERMFKCWMKFTQEEQLEGLEKKEVADFHNQMKLKLKYLKIWQNYKKLKRLEAAKENRKRIWRRKVLEILPDYQPIHLSDDF